MQASLSQVFAGGWKARFPKCSPSRAGGCPRDVASLDDTPPRGSHSIALRCSHSTLKHVKCLGWRLPPRHVQLQPLPCNVTKCRPCTTFLMSPPYRISLQPSVWCRQSAYQPLHPSRGALSTHAEIGCCSWVPAGDTRLSQHPSTPFAVNIVCRYILSSWLNDNISPYICLPFGSAVIPLPFLLISPQSFLSNFICLSLLTYLTWAGRITPNATTSHPPLTHSC